MRRRRALAFGLAALLAAAVAATVADGYGDSVARGYGALRPVVVAAAELEAGRAIGPVEAEALEVRRIPLRFVPPGTLAAPAAALGLVPAAAIPAGSYLQAAQLRPPRRDAAVAGLGGGRRPVEISVAGPAVSGSGGPALAGRRVDVVVTTEPSGSGPGRAYVAAASVPLLALRPGAEGTATATLGLTRRQALRLIAAESFARQLTLLPRAGR